MEIKIEWRNGKKYRMSKTKLLLCCETDGCTNYRARVRGSTMCVSHGGGIKCYIKDCNTISIIHGFCYKHSDVDRPSSGIKNCSRCNEEKDIVQFYSDRKKIDGLESCCKQCNKNGRDKYLNTLDGYVKINFCSLKCSARKRKIEMDITVKDIIELYDRQKGRCALTGIDLIISHEKIPMKLSVDRIDSSKGYSVNNIQLVVKILNLMKWETSNDDFIKFCKKVANYRKQNK